MLYVSIDIETTGISPETCQILEVAAVIEDTEDAAPVETLPSFSTLVKHDTICGDHYALEMNRALIQEIYGGDGGDEALAPAEAISELSAFLFRHIPNERLTLAGKNIAGFDYQFIKRLPSFEAAFPDHRHRFIDVGNQVFDIHTDDKIPAMSECLEAVGLKAQITHRALDDARLNIEVLRRTWDLI